MYSAQFLAELALAALKDCHRNAALVASAALDNALRRELDDDFAEAVALANKAIMVRDAIAWRISMLEPDIGAMVAANLGAGDEQQARPLH